MSPAWRREVSRAARSSPAAAARGLRSESRQHARPYGGPNRVLRVEVHHDQVRVSVLDDGPGLAAGLAGRLFEPLATGGASGSLGLGISVSRQLARAMGGDLGFDQRAAWTMFELVLRRTGWSPSASFDDPSILSSVGI